MAHLFEDDASTHRVDDRLGLLENLLLHKRRKLSLHDLLQFEFELVDAARSVVAGRRRLDPMQSEAALHHRGDVVVFQVNNTIGVFDNSTENIN